MAPRTLLLTLSGLLGLGSLQLAVPSACVASVAPAIAAPRVLTPPRVRRSASPYAILSDVGGACRPAAVTASPCDDAATEAPPDERPVVTRSRPG